MKTDRKKILIDIKVMYILAGLLLLICLVLYFYFNMKVRHYPSSYGDKILWEVPFNCDHEVVFF